MNATILQNLKEMRDLEKTKKELYKVRAYNTAIRSIEAHNRPITSGGDAKKLNGVGDKIAKKIQEILDTGELHQIKDITNESRILKELGSVWGIGPTKAKTLMEQGIRSIKQLHNKRHLLTRNQKLGLQYHSDIIKKIPRGIIKQYAEKVSRVLINHFGTHFDLTVAGSFRRGAQESGDIDILLKSTTISLREIVEFLSLKGFVTEVLTLGDDKAMIIGGDKRSFHRIDFEMVTPNKWGTALLYFTGSGPFNVRMRQHAKDNGWTLSEHHVKNNKTKEIITFETEEEVFHFFGQEYVDPCNRK